MDRRGGSAPVQGRRDAHGPNAELNAALQRRRRIIEGIHSPASLGALDATCSLHQIQQHASSQRAINARSSSPTATPSRSFFACSSVAKSARCTFGIGHGTSGPARYNLACPPPSTGSNPGSAKHAIAAPCASVSIMSASPAGYPSHPLESPPSGFRSPVTPRALQESGAFDQQPGSQRLANSPVRKIEAVGSMWSGCSMQSGKPRSFGFKLSSGNLLADLAHDSTFKIDTGRYSDTNGMLSGRTSLRSTTKDASKVAKGRDSLQIDLWSQLEALKKQLEQESRAKKEALSQNSALEKQVLVWQETCGRHSETLKMQQEQISRESCEREKLVRSIQDLQLSSQKGQERIKDMQEVLDLKKDELGQAYEKLNHQFQKHACTVEENERLIVQMAQLQGEKNAIETELSRQEEDDRVATSSEGRLRSAMTRPNSSTEDLKQAIKGVEVLLSEAHRELSSRLHREKRAAYERLHEAEMQDNEIVLEEAVAEARRTGINEEDVEKTENKLRHLRSLTDEQRAMKAAKEIQAQRKARAFLLVKKDDGAQLAKVLDDAAKEEHAVKWQDWRDHAGRSLLQFSRELQAASVQRLLTSLSPTPPNGEAPRWRPSWAKKADDRTASPKVDNIRLGSSEEESTTCAHKHHEIETPTAVQSTGKLEEYVKIDESKCKREADEIDCIGRVASPSDARDDSTCLQTEEHAESKAQALRAVVQDDTVALAEVLDRLPVESWAHWKNKAGKDLITLAQERGSSDAYSLLARLLGLLKEMKRDSFDDREAVWILIQGDVQPRRATVVEDTSEDAEEVLVEFWDDDAPPSHIDRRSVLILLRTLMSLETTTFTWKSAIRQADL